MEHVAFSGGFGRVVSRRWPPVRSSSPTGARAGRRPRTPWPRSRAPASSVPTASSSTCAAAPTASCSSTTTRRPNRSALFAAHPFAEIRAAHAVGPDARRGARRVRGAARQRRGEVPAVGAGRRPRARRRPGRGRSRPGAGRDGRRLVVRPRNRRRGARLRARAPDRVPRPPARSAGRGRGSPASTATRGCIPNVDATLADLESVALAHDLGLRVDVWTVDDPDEIRALAAAGVDAIITNVPDVALAALA